MALTLSISPVYGVEKAVAERGVDEVLSVMPRGECSPDGWCRWPEVSLPHTVVEVSDFGCGQLVPQAEMDEIACRDPSLIPPTESHVRSIIELGRRVIRHSREVDWHLLVHCQAGVSRSAAAAYVIFALQDGPGREKSSFERLWELYGFDGPPPMPNLNIVHLADGILGRNGALFKAASEHVAVKVA